MLTLTWTKVTDTNRYTRCLIRHSPKLLAQIGIQDAYSDVDQSYLHRYTRCLIWHRPKLLTQVYTMLTLTLTKVTYTKRYTQCLLWRIPKLRTHKAILNAYSDVDHRVVKSTANYTGTDSLMRNSSWLSSNHALTLWHRILLQSVSTFSALWGLHHSQLRTRSKILS